MQAILIGILGALFFSVTFILNHAMANDEGNWLFSASLRFLFMFPILFIIIYFKKNLSKVHHHIKLHFVPWIIWSTLGFVFFYMPITFVANYSPGWLISATWQLTIICGLLLAPFFYEYVQINQQQIKIRERISWRSVGTSSIMVFGVVLVQVPQVAHIEMKIFIMSVLPLIIGAFCYPLGNRKMMILVDNQLNTLERIYGMTLVTLPIWVIIFICGVLKTGPPSSNQVIQTFIVAVFSGIIATSLFFYATNMVKHSQAKLAAVESTQATEIIFTLIGEMILLGLPLPSTVSIVGIFMITIGIVIYSFMNSIIKENNNLTL
ncbi:multidrug resistance efflux transporter family protein [Staphylococcus sp. GSSP0090]|nr:multidrug resistance efflux transporter family protein [Staphylococcus sp. GSSP0090]